MQCFTLILVIILVGICANDLIVRDRDESIGDVSTQYRAQMFNFASQAAGAVVLDKSPSSAKGYHNLLNDDKDKYGISDCNEKKWVVIGLSEEVMITSVEMLNYEKYSSMLKDFQLLASSSYPTDEWINLGTYTALPRLGSQAFNVSTATEAHARYLKVKFLTHYSDEALCTLSQIKVFGMTVIAAFQQEVQRSDHNMRDMLSQLNSEDEPAVTTTTTIAAEVAAESPDAMPSTGLEDVITHDPNSEVSDSASGGDSSSIYELEGSTDRAAAGGDQLPMEDTGESHADSSAAPPSPEGAKDRTGRDTKGSPAVSEDVSGGAAEEEECPQPSLPGRSSISSSGEAEQAVYSNDTRCVDSSDKITTAGKNISYDATADDSQVALPPVTAATAAEFVENITSSEHCPAVSCNESATASVALPAEAGIPAVPAGPGYAPFDLAGKVKRLLPGLFSSPDQPAGTIVEETEGTAEGAHTPEPVVELEVGASGGGSERAAATNITEEATVSPTGRAAAESPVTAIAEANVSVSASSENATVRGDTPTERVSAAAESLTTITVSVVNATSPAHIPSIPADNAQNARGAGGVLARANGAGLTLPEPSAVTIGSRPGSVGSSAVQKPITVSALKTTSPSTAAGAGAALSASALAGGLPNVTINCFETLSFSEFSRKMRAKLQQFNSANASSSNSSSSSGSTAVEEALALAQQQGVGGRDSNVFKALMQKIKALEMNAAIVDMYTTQVQQQHSGSS